MSEQIGQNDLHESPDRVPDPETQPTTTVERAGRHLGISRSSAYAAAASGELPTIRIGSRLVVPTAALRRMLGLDEHTPV